MARCHAAPVWPVAARAQITPSRPSASSAATPAWTRPCRAAGASSATSLAAATVRVWSRCPAGQVSWADMR
ncbi:MAG TPA: hypothetical protein VEF71_12110 [Streptosporangiaceae bacterium]|nr:hypothetical protein [Streptosporangiaceae bacterium]